MPEVEPLSWRAVLALLANVDARGVLAEVVGHGPSGPARERALEKLRSAGLIEAAPDGTLVVAEARLRATLRQAGSPPASGPQRFLSGDGRIAAYPARRQDRLDLLRLVAERSVGVGEDLTEAELGERLAQFSDDVATLRRYLVDAGLLERSADGRSYRRGSPAPTGT